MTEKETQLQETARQQKRPEYLPATDVYEYEKEIVVLADMPGAKQDDVSVDLENNVLTISAQSVPETTDTKDYRLLRGEYEPVDFKRTFEILEDVDEEGITANLQHGVLKVVLPKVEAPKARKIQIKVNE